MEVFALTVRLQGCDEELSAFIAYAVSGDWGRWERGDLGGCWSCRGSRGGGSLWCFWFLTGRKEIIISDGNLKMFSL